MVSATASRQFADSSAAVADFLCRAEDNVYGIEFVRFKIRDMETNATVRIGVSSTASLIAPLSMFSALRNQQADRFDGIMYANRRASAVADGELDDDEPDDEGDGDDDGSESDTAAPTSASQATNEDEQTYGFSPRFIRYYFKPSFLKVREWRAAGRRLCALAA